MEVAGQAALVGHVGVGDEQEKTAGGRPSSVQGASAGDPLGG
jgi:hypothetical protein